MVARRIFVALLVGLVATVVAVSIAATIEPDASAPATAPAAPADGLARLTVNVVDLRSRDGQVIFGVFTSAKGFPSDAKRACNWQVRKIDADTMQFIADLPPGKYAATALHDQNSNNKLDQNFFGVPTEGYGVTNNPKPRFRAAKFSEAVVTLPEDGATVTISLQYF